MARLMIFGAFLLVCTVLAAAGTNPLLAPWKTPFGVPPWGGIKPDDFLPALKEAVSRHDREIAAIVNNPKAPTFVNTVEALEDSGELLSRVSAAFDALTSAETNDRLQEIAKTVAPLLSAHADDVALNPGLFRRVKTVYDKRETLKLTREQAMLLERTHRRFIRGGALLEGKDRDELRKINEELSLLGLRFGDNLRKVVNTWRLVIDRREDLAGLPENAVSAAAEAAARAGLEGKWVITLQAPSFVPFLTYADARTLREKVWDAYITRCDRGDAQDNKAILSRIAGLRARKARLLGFPTWADFTLDDRMAKTPARVITLLDQVLAPALAKAKADAADLQAMIDAEKGGFRLAAWDWRYYAEKRKKALFDLDDETLRPYFELDHVRQGAFYVANRLYGLQFVERKDVPVYHPEVRVYEVKEADGRTLGLLYQDYHPRPGKRGGAWCGALREQWTDRGRNVMPIVFNVANFSRPVGDTPALLGYGEVETLFHEFGHALHYLLSKCRYRSLGGANVTWDFVELPSQVMEHWVSEPGVMAVFARHYQTDAVIPPALVEKIRKSDTYNQGYQMAQLAAASRLDLDWHLLAEPKEPEAAAFEKASLERMGLPDLIPPMHRSPYFRHIFSGDYAAGYYSYLWSAVLDADAFEAFKEKGNVFDPATAKAFREHVLSRGWTEDAMTLYLRFRGKEPKVDALLEQKGLK
ncbi:MAG: M3 family metallopeptidase [Acidobacteria bacterium]|nr:M3 family metallopeptidase [Acidobacteriota bacterium]